MSNEGTRLSRTGLPLKNPQPATPENLSATTPVFVEPSEESFSTPVSPQTPTSYQSPASVPSPVEVEPEESELEQFASPNSNPSFEDHLNGDVDSSAYPAPALDSQQPEWNSVNEASTAVEEVEEKKSKKVSPVLIVLLFVVLIAAGAAYYFLIMPGDQNLLANSAATAYNAGVDHVSSFLS